MPTPTPQFLCLAVWGESGDSIVTLVSQDGAIDLERKEAKELKE